ncbi:MAG: DNA polymerase III subunit gamma/tau [Microthrixaceae bacterium]|nr:DNA polymerase III subunit gamma/tau [Microthrixaceae bacterium]
MSQQSLYRRYRPRRFSEVRGQEHIVRALRNAISGETAGQAYLFSGPRGTGKTTTARILAKVLNCTDVRDGEPCGECESCLAMDAGSSYDLFELDAASNNGVDAMRDLISRAAVGSPGRTKVYILDEVHMLSAAASNALLKTLEEPPDHVTFVLATTDPQKVLPTIRSRTQHFEFSLLSAEQLEDYVRWVVADAGLSVDDAGVAHVVRAGRGSARDMLSALDQVVAAGGVLDRPEVLAELAAAVGDRDTSRALVAVAEALDQGRDPRVVGEALLGALRDAFLVAVGAPAGHLSDADRTAAANLGGEIGAAGLTRALELLGAALIEMRQAADPRIPLEVALVRITDSSTDTTLGGLAERVSQLEREVARVRLAAPAGEGGDATPSRRSPSGQAISRPAAPAPRDIPPPPSRSAAASKSPPPVPETARPPSIATTSTAPLQAGSIPTAAQLTAALNDVVLPQLRAVARAVFAGGRFTTVDGGVATFALPNGPMLERAGKARADVEAALTGYFGQAVTLTLVVDGGSSAPAPVSTGDSPIADQAPSPGPESDECVDLSELTDATDVAGGGANKLTQAFPGAVVVEEDQ